MKHYILIFLYLCFVLFVQCNTTELKPSRTKGLNYIEPPKPLSMLTIPVTINMRDVNTLLNTKLGSVLYSDVSFEDNNIDNLKLTLTKRNTITVSIVGKGIQVFAPLHIQGTYRFSKSAFGKTIYHEQPVSLNLTAIIHSIPTITTNWMLKTSSKATIRWDDLPVYEFAGTKLDLPSLFAQALESQTNKLAAMMDAEIPKQVKLREELLKLWPQLTTPNLIDQKTNSWFIIRPKEFYTTPFSAINGNLQFSVGLASVLEITVNEKPLAEKSPGLFLPPMLTIPKLNDKLQLLISPEISFTLMDSLLREVLKDPQYRKIESQDYSFDILEAIVFPVHNAISIGIKIDGWARYGKKIKKITGLVYVEGLPSFDEKTQQLKIANLGFSLKTKDVLLKSASWLLNVSPLMHKIEKALVFPVGKEIEQAKEQAKIVLNKRYGNIVQLNGVITQIVPQPGVITLTSLRMPIYVEGTVGVTIDGFAKK